jgi:RNA polymerase sigma-70 factor (ECF subfamily)
MEDTFQTRISLVQRIRDVSDSRSWSEFYTFYRPLLMKYVCAKGLSEADAEDVVQDIFVVKLRRHMPNFQLDKTKGRFRSWLYLVTINAVRDWARERKGFEKIADELKNTPREDAESVSVIVEQEFDRAHQLHVLEKAMEEVKKVSEPVTWACFEGRILANRPAGEIARELGLTANAVYVNASRTLSRVREICAEFDEELGRDRVPA